MRKLSIFMVMVAALVCFYAAQASAEEKTIDQRVTALENGIGAWSFYGSARMDTFYQWSDKWYDAPNGTNQWSYWGQPVNSRIGATVNKGALGGKIEIGLTGDSSHDIRTRLIYGTYTVNDLTLLVGQDYSPLGGLSYSNQIYGSDTDMQDYGIIDELRVPQIKISYKGLEVAFIDPINQASADYFRPDFIDDDGELVDPKTGDEVLLPHVELKYGMATDKFFVDLFGGYGTFKEKSDYPGVDPKKVTAHAYGANVGVTLDPAYASIHLYRAVNPNQLGLTDDVSANCFIDENEDMHNSRTVGMAAMAGFKVNDKVNLEAGIAYIANKVRQYDTYELGTDDDGDPIPVATTKGRFANRAKTAYVQAVINVASMNGAKFVVVPEIGFFDEMKDSDGDPEGSFNYAGMRWMINF
jgi:hypothetical protein